MKSPEPLNRDRSMLLVIDMQTRLLPHIRASAEAVAAAVALLEGTDVFSVPAMATVQYVKGLGPADDTIADRCNALRIPLHEKMSFSVVRDETCRRRLQELGRPQIVVTGIEAHVCVQQTVLDLLDMGLEPVVCADAVASRRADHHALALERMRQSGAAITTTESVLFDWCGVSGTSEFKAMLAVIKRFDAARADAGSRHGVS